MMARKWFARAPGLFVAGMLLLGVAGESRPAAAAGPAQTPPPPCVVGGVLAGDVNVTWPPPDCRHVAVRSNTLVMAGVTLVILPGTEVRVAPGVVLRVHGTLVARGTAAAPIRFLPDSVPPLPGTWRGIDFSGTGAVLDDAGGYVSGSILEHVEIVAAGQETEAALSLAWRPGEASGSPLLDHLVIRASATNGISKKSPGPLTLRDSWLTGNGANGLAVHEAGSLQVERNVIASNAGAGIYLSGSVSMPLRATDNLLSHNAVAGLRLNAGQAHLSRNRIIHNGWPGVGDGGIVVGDPTAQLAARENELYGNVDGSGQPRDVANHSQAMLEARDNWWGTTSAEVVGQHILDFDDDPQLGPVFFQPLRREPVYPPPLPRLWLPLSVQP